MLAEIAVSPIEKEETVSKYVAEVVNYIKNKSEKKA